jgi:hypothetical protein
MFITATIELFSSSGLSWLFGFVVVFLCLADEIVIENFSWNVCRWVMKQALLRFREKSASHTNVQAKPSQG